MATVYKVLGQVSPSVASETTLYIVGTLKSSVCSSIVVCNRSSVPSTFRVSISQGGVATSNKDYLYYDVAIAGNDTFISTIGLTLAAGDVVRVYSSSSSLSFQLFGSEIS